MKKVIFIILLSILCLSCARTAKVTLVNEHGYKVDYEEETYSLSGKVAGDSIPLAMLKKGDKINYTSPLKTLFIKKGKKLSDGSIYLGHKKFIIQSIEFQIDGLE